MNFRIRAGLTAASLLLVGCSDRGTSPALTVLRNGLAAQFAPAQEIRAPQDKPYIVVGYLGARSPMTKIAQRGDVVSYEGIGGVEMTLRNGLLARLRGLGQEFEALYLSNDSPYLGDLLDAAQSGHTLTRNMEFWDDEKPKRVRFYCRLSESNSEFGWRKVSEHCHSAYGQTEFQNTYLFDSRAQLIKSSQWFHPEAAHLDIEHIVSE